MKNLTEKSVFFIFAWLPRAIAYLIKILYYYYILKLNNSEADMLRLIIIALVFSAGLIRADTNICFEGRPLGDNHRAHEMLRSFQVGMEQRPIKICSWEDSEKSSISVTFFNNIWVIVATTRTLSEFSDEALKGALAHELGHVLINSAGSLKNKNERDKEDREADAIALKLVGKEALLATYVAHTRDKNLARRRVNRALEIMASDQINKYLY
ncbi:MAG: hypothetical protein Q8Q06_03600 [bacterium]|nr:hypothetical protein [bacterium]